MSQTTRSSDGAPESRVPLRTRARQAGFTLVEVMVASTIGAVLLMTAAYTAGAYSSAVAALTSDTFSDQELAMARIMQDVRYGYWVQLPRPAAIEIGDARGRVRSYHLDTGNIVATEYDSTTGVLCGGVASLAFTSQDIQRLREATPTTTSGRFLNVTTNNVVDRTLALGEGGSVAVPFMIATDAGEGAVSGVVEQILDVTPTTLSLPIASALNRGTLRAEIFEARAPGDARPRPGVASLGSATISVGALPAAYPAVGATPASIFAVLTEMYGVTNQIMVGAAKVTLPLGSIGNLIALIVSFDNLVIDPAYDPLTAEVVRTVAPFATPGTNVPIDVSGSFAALEPGVAYTLVLSVESGAGVGVLASSAATALDDRIAIRSTRAGSLLLQDFELPFSMSGTRRVTATTEADSVAVVQAELVPTVGVTLTKATPVYSQALAPDPWYGTLPGEASP